MGNILDLHNDLLRFIPNVYNQPPSNIQMKYPCIIYTKSDKKRNYGNNAIYFSKQGYQLMIIEHDPNSGIADDIESQFEHCIIDQYYTVDNLNHTTINLYY